jgi:hypothetical protein
VIFVLVTKQNHLLNKKRTYTNDYHSKKSSHRETFGGRKSLNMPVKNQGGKRRVFRVENDLALLELVRAHNPYTATYGAVKNQWEKISELLAEHLKNEGDDLHDCISWQVLRNRADRLLEKYRNDEMQSLKKSGKVESFSQVMTTLEDIRTQIADHDEKKDKEREEKRIKKEKIVSDGEKHREEASARVGDRTPSSENSSESDRSTTSKKRRTLFSPEALLQQREERHTQQKELRERELKVQEQKLELEAKRLAIMEATLLEEKKEREQYRVMMLTMFERLLPQNN